MSRKITISIMLFACCLFSVISCKKISTEPTISTKTKSLQSIPAFPLDWENIDYMPTPAGQPPILVPWASGSNQLFAPEQALDFNKSDGWILVYNTFSSTQNTSLKFFSLYNKYRGLIRFYMYIPPGSPTPSTYLTDGLGISGTATSSIINFGGSISDVDNPTKSITRIQNYNLQSTGAWYISQFEIAYDPNIANTSYQNLNFVWNLASTSVTNVNLNGEVNGTLTGTVGKGSAGGFNPGGLLNNAEKATLYAAGLSTLSSLKVNKSNIATSILNGLKGGLSGAVTGLISAIIGGTPTTPQMINLQIESDVQLTGTFSSGSGIASPTLIIPGSSNSQNGPGYVPAYNEILGVFNFTNSPTFDLEIDSAEMPFIYAVNPIRGDIRYSYTHIFQKATPYATLNINPVLTSNGTTVQIVRQDLLIPYTPETVTVPSPVFDDKYEIDVPAGTYNGQEEILGTSYIVADITNLNNLTVEFSGVRSGQVDKLQYDKAIVRYTIQVTPPNNGEPITIVRSVKAKRI